MTNNKYYNHFLLKVEAIKVHGRESWSLKDLQQENFNKILIDRNIDPSVLDQNLDRKQAILDKEDKLAKKESLA